MRSGASSCRRAPRRARAKDVILVAHGSFFVANKKAMLKSSQVIGAIYRAQKADQASCPFPNIVDISAHASACVPDTIRLYVSLVHAMHIDCAPAPDLGAQDAKLVAHLARSLAANSIMVLARAYAKRRRGARRLKHTS
jgi:hypothetical protein